MRLVMIVTPDIYELPLGVYDSYHDAARHMGLYAGNIVNVEKRHRGEPECMPRSPRERYRVRTVTV